MTIPRLPRINVGGTPTATGYNRAVAEIERAHRLRGIAPLQVQFDATGFTLSIDTTTVLSWTLPDGTTLEEYIASSAGGTFSGPVVTNASLTVNEQLLFNSQTVAVSSGSVTQITITTPAPIIQLSLAGDCNIYSIDAPVSNWIMWLVNTTSYTAYLVSDDGSTGTASERFSTPSGDPCPIGPGQWVPIWYDNAASRWRPGLPPVSTVWPTANPATITTSQNDYDPGDGIVAFLNIDNAVSITGFLARPHGSPLLIVNCGDSTLTIPHQDTGSSAANRVITTTGSSLSVPSNSWALLVYQGGSVNRYYATAFGGGSGVPSTGGTFTGNVTLNQSLTVNEDGGDFDTRIEGDTEVNLFFADASTDRVGIGTNTPSSRLAVAGGSTTVAPSTTSYSSLNIPHGTAPTSPTNGDVWTTTAGVFVRINGSTMQLGSGGVTDHGALTGLGDDDHTQYALLTGRSGGQELKGGTGSGDRLDLESTSNATKGGIRLKADNFLELPTISVPSSPSAGFGRLYPKTDKKLYYKDEDGVEVDLTAGGGSGFPEWVAYEFDYTDLMDPASTQYWDFHDFLAGQMIHAAIMSAPTYFSNGNGATISFDLGNTDSAQRYFSSFAPNSSDDQYTHSASNLPDVASITTNKDFRLTANIYGGLGSPVLDDMTQGVLRVWLLVSSPPAP